MKKTAIIISLLVCIVTAGIVALVYNIKPDNSSPPDEKKYSKVSKKVDSSAKYESNDVQDNGYKSTENPTEQNAEGKYIIGFYDYEKKLITSQKAQDGDKIIPPDKIEVPYGYVFTGWDKNFRDIYENMRINAEFLSIADKTNVFFANSVGGKKGDKITVNVGLGGKVELCSANVTLAYDNEKLKLTGLSSLDEEVLVNSDEDEGKIYFNIVSNENITGDVDLFEAEFRLLSGEPTQTEISVESAELVRLTEKNEIVPADYYSALGMIYIY